MHLQISRWSEPGNGSFLWANSNNSQGEKPFHHQRADPEFSPVILNGYHLNEAPCFERLLGTQAHFRPHVELIHRSIAKGFVGQWLAHFIAPGSTWFLPYFTFTRLRSKIEYCCNAYNGSFNAHFTSPDIVQSRLCWGMTFFYPRTAPFPHHIALYPWQMFRRSHALLLQSQTFLD